MLVDRDPVPPGGHRGIAADTALAVAFVRGCDWREVYYILSLSTNERLKAISEPFMDQAEADFQRTQEKQR